MVTYADMFTYTLVLCAVATLVADIANPQSPCFCGFAHYFKKYQKKLKKVLDIYAIIVL